MQNDNYKFTWKRDGIMKKLDYESFREFSQLYDLLFVFILITLREPCFFEFDKGLHFSLHKQLYLSFFF